MSQKSHLQVKGPHASSRGLDVAPLSMLLGGSRGAALCPARCPVTLGGCGSSLRRLASWATAPLSSPAAVVVVPGPVSLECSPTLPHLSGEPELGQDQAHSLGHGPVLGWGWESGSQGWGQPG